MIYAVSVHATSSCAYMVLISTSITQRPRPNLPILNFIKILFIRWSTCNAIDLCSKGFNVSQRVGSYLRGTTLEADGMNTLKDDLFLRVTMKVQTLESYKAWKGLCSLQAQDSSNSHQAVVALVPWPRRTIFSCFHIPQI